MAAIDGPARPFMAAKFAVDSPAGPFVGGPSGQPTNLRNGTPDSAKYLFCETHQNESKQLPSLLVIVLNKIEQKFTPEK